MTVKQLLKAYVGKNKDAVNSEVEKQITENSINSTKSIFPKQISDAHETMFNAASISQEFRK